MNLIELIRKDKGIEINSSGIGYGLGSPHPNIEILNRYKDLGGKIITMGSDAHKSKELAKNFDISFDILEQVGFDAVTIFHQRNPEFIKIKQLKKKLENLKKELNDPSHDQRNINDVYITFRNHEIAKQIIEMNQSSTFCCQKRRKIAIDLVYKGKSLKVSVPQDQPSNINWHNLVYNPKQ